MQFEVMMKYYLETEDRLHYKRLQRKITERISLKGRKQEKSETIMFIPYERPLSRASEMAPSFLDDKSQ